MNLNDYKAEKNDQFTPNMIADELKKLNDSVDDCILVISKDGVIETYNTSNDAVSCLGLLEMGKQQIFDDSYEEY